jgi:Baseplate J-like protein
VPDEQQPVTDQEPELPEPEPSVPTATIRTRKKTRTLLLLSLVSLVALGIGFLLPLVYPLLFVPAATIALEPDVQRLTTRAQIRLVPNSTHPLAVNEIPAIMLPQVSVSQQQHVPATGRVHQQATLASGTVTFFNFLTATQTIGAGTLLTGADGEEVTVDQDVTIPAGTLSANGEASVTAHAVSYGSVGNISAGDIYGPCCRVGIQVSNAQFSGGKDQKDFTIVTKQEYETLVASVTQSVTEKASGLSRPGPGDVLIQPVPCRNTLHADHQPGEASTSLTVTVTRTCTPESYHPQDLQTAILATMTTDAQTKLDKDYRCVMQAVAVSTPAIENNKVTIPIVVLSTWVFDLSAQTQTMRLLLAGKTKQQAMQLLTQQPGVKKVVSLELRNTSQLPMKPEQITIVAKAVIYP